MDRDNPDILNTLFALTHRVNAHEEVGPGDMDTTLASVAAYMDTIERSHRPAVSVHCGRLVEAGGDPGIVGPGLLNWLSESLAKRGFFARRRGMKADEQRRFELGIISHLSKSKALRREARSQGLLDLITVQSKEKTFLTTLLQVLDDEPLVVLHPAEGKGYACRISGIPDNFHLFTLIEDALIGDPASGWLHGDKPDPRLAKAVTPLEDIHAAAQLQEWNWTGLTPDGVLPVDPNKGVSHWLWREGKPVDVLTFCGTRVVLLGPLSVRRSLNSGRMFKYMEPEFTVEQILSSAEAADWLARITAAINAEGDWPARIVQHR